MTINTHDVYLCTLSEIGVDRGFSAVDPVQDSRGWFSSGKQGNCWATKQGWRVKSSCPDIVSLGKLYIHSFI